MPTTVATRRRLPAALRARLLAGLVLLAECLALLIGFAADRAHTAATPSVILLADRMISRVGEQAYSGYDGFTVEEGCTGEVMTTNWIEMPAGMYNLTVAYTGGGDDVEIQFHNSDIEMGCIRLPADTRAVTVQAYVPTAQTQATLVVNTEGSGIQLESIVLEPSQAYGWFRLLRRFFLLLVLDFFAWVWVRRLPFPGGRRGRVTALSLGVITLLATLPFLTSNLVAGHDLPFHLNRIEGLAQGLAGGQFPVRIQPFWLEGNGYAVSVFYGDLFLYIPAVLRLLGVPLQTAYQFYVFLASLATAVVSWWCARRMFGDDAAALCVSALYTLSGYRLVDVYTRGAVGEYTALIFLPLVCYGLWQILRQPDGARARPLIWLPATVGYAGLLQSHLLTTEMAGAFTLLLCLVCVRRVFRRNTFFPLLKVVGAAVAASAWYLVPLFDYMRGDFKVHSAGQYGGVGRMGAFPAQMFGLFFDASPELTATNVDMGTVQEMAIGVGTAVLLAAALFVAVRFLLEEPLAETEHKLLRIGGLGLWFGLLCFWMSSVLFPWHAVESLHPVLARLCTILQYPWRLEGLGTWFWVLAGGCALVLLRRRSSWRLGAGAVLCVVTLVTWGSMSQSYLATDIVENYYSAAALDSVAISGEEYLPADADRYVIADSQTPITVNAEVTDWSRQGVRVELQVTVSQQADGAVTVPLLYYPYYTACDDAGNPLAVDSDPDTWQVRVAVPSGYSGGVTVSFRPPWFWHAAEACSALFLLALAGYAVWLHRRRAPTLC